MAALRNDWLEPQLPPRLTQPSRLQPSRPQPSRSQPSWSAPRHRPSATMAHSGSSWRQQSLPAMVPSRPSSRRPQSGAMIVAPTKSLVSQRVAPLAQPKPPRWVQRLTLAQRGVCVVAIATVTAALGLYGQSVYYQRQWGQNYARLQRLKKLEQQGTTANELIKDALIRTGEGASANLSVPLPGSALLVEKAPTPQSLEAIPTPVPAALKFQTNAPKGY